MLLPMLLIYCLSCLVFKNDGLTLCRFYSSPPESSVGRPGIEWTVNAFSSTTVLHRHRVDRNNHQRRQVTLSRLAIISAATTTVTSTCGGADQDFLQSSTSSFLSPAAEWHKQRRKQMMELYGKEFRTLEQSSSQWIGLPLLVMGNISLLLLSIWCGTSSSSSIPIVVGVAIFPGSILSLWQLQILHDVLHGSALQRDIPSTIQLTIPGRTEPIVTITKTQLQKIILFWGSMPSVFGYYLYLSRGHMSHHRNVGSTEATLERLFDSNQVDFEDGDVLFVSHRMKLHGPIGPQFQIPPMIQQILGAPTPETFRLSLSRTGFGSWQEGNAIWNAIVFSTSFLIERYALCWNDVLVAITGRNGIFFPNKPDAFHNECATYARCAVTVRGSIFLFAGWKALLFLFLSESLWSIPPHPACAMFVTNHGSRTSTSSSTVREDGIDVTSRRNDDGGMMACQPSSSTYAGAWYSWMTLGTNYHVEHHDFPTIPFHLLYRCKEIAPEFYSAFSPITSTTAATTTKSLRSESNKEEQEDDDEASRPHHYQHDNVFDVMRDAFAYPDFYACSDASPGSLIVRADTRKMKRDSTTTTT
jgi:fatty acid desaturase